MQKILVGLSSKQAEELAGQLVKQLNRPAKLRLAEKLDLQTRSSRWEPLLRKIRQRLARRRSLSPQEIRRISEKVRQERYQDGRGARRH